ncbi:uncharacterized protein Z520_04593 [Fonsecaea multimorphosa CBS 102226]|uniref:Uncharacterized protein n=1 Tax=Fonsecaea multimorphosa CBS 102226 TaxID=1442371 RepID=A0A0D2HDJ2_9EURO|nr:uncharacterized protein Z520_04593 [Fonsecaea multimorphosa CBS 102226]KIX99955.1 hypothetical protein Z520_04593 [Fonsecaea multimorphosa CBS 102226]
MGNNNSFTNTIAITIGTEQEHQLFQIVQQPRCFFARHAKIPGYPFSNIGTFASSVYDQCSKWADDIAINSLFLPFRNKPSR